MSISKQARKDAERRYQLIINDYTNRLYSLFNNSVNVLNKPEDLPKRYLLKMLLSKGAIAYDPATQLFLPYTEYEIDIYGLPKAYNLVGWNGYTKRVSASSCVILRSNDYAYPIKDYIDIQVKKMADFDMAIEQNLEAIKTMSILECNDENALLTLKNNLESRRIGATVAVVNKQSISGINYTVMGTEAEYLVDKLQEARMQVFNETINTLGIITANTDKRERVQEAEVDASTNYVDNAIGVLIDTFNHDAEVGGLAIRLERNTKVPKDDENEYTEDDNVKEEDIDNEEL